MSEQPGRLRREWKKFLAGLLGFALAADMLLNGVTGGSFDETISSRAGRAVLSGATDAGAYAAKGLCAVLNVIDKDHCVDAALNKGG